MFKINYFLLPGEIDAWIFLLDLTVLIAFPATFFFWEVMLASAKYQDVKLPREQSCSEFAWNSSKVLRKRAAKTETETEKEV